MMLGLIVLLAVVASAQTQPAPGATPQRLRISSKVAQANIAKSVPPRYPERARAEGVTGSVIMIVLIDKDGHVEDVKPVAGHAELVESAVYAVQHWKYKPFLLNGVPVPVETQVTVNFTIVRR